MAKYEEREFKLGNVWLSKRANSPSWCRTFYDNDTRQTRRVSLDTTDYEEAKKRLTGWFIAQHQPETLKTEEIGIGLVLDRYWERHAKSVAAAHTIKGQLGYWKEYHGDLTVAEACSYGRQRSFKAWLRQRGLGPSTINHTMMCCRAACRMAWKMGEIESVPAFDMERVGEQEPMGRPLTIEECARLLREAKEEHMRTLLMWLMGTAARPGAILDLEYRQVDHQARTINLNKSGRKQNKKYRPIIKLPDALSGYHGDGFVVNWAGRHVSSVKTSWRKLRTRAGLERDVTLYSYRGTVARWLRKEGVPLQTIQLQLVHAHEGVTVRYIGRDPEYLNDACAAIDRFISTVCKAC